MTATEYALAKQIPALQQGSGCRIACAYGEIELNGAEAAALAVFLNGLLRQRQEAEDGEQ